jgi:hypothetical protein
MTNDDLPSEAEATYQAETDPTPRSDVEQVGAGGVAPAPEATEGKAPNDLYPGCPSLTYSEYEAAQALINELAPGTRNDFYWLGFGVYETIAKHMRLAAQRLDEERREADDGSPRCHPGAFWALGGDPLTGSFAVCSVCNARPFDSTYVRKIGPAEIGPSAQWTPEELARFAASNQAPLAPPVVLNRIPEPVAAAKVMVADANAGPRPEVPPCHAFAGWVSKGDGTEVCMFCGSPWSVIQKALVSNKL